MATISFQTTFNLVLTPKQVILNDTTDWAGLHISTSDVNAVFTITAPSGTVIYNNTDYTNSGCDIWISNSLISQHVIPLPLGSDLFPESGNYTIACSIYDSNRDLYYTQINTVNYQYTSPVICINQRIDCITPLFSSVDATNYTVNSVVPVIDGTHTLDYPYGSAGENTPTVLPFTAEASVIAVSTFYQGTQTTEIVAGLIYNVVTGVNGWYIIDSVSGSKEIKVDCAYICSILCCVRTYDRIKEGYRYTNRIKFVEYDDIFQEIMSCIGLMQFSINCGLGDEVCNYLERIKRLSNCNSACDCGSDTPSRVIGLGYLVGPAGPAGAQGVQGAAGNNGNYITVTAEDAGVNCTTGGSKVILYNGVTNAIISTSYICNGELGEGSAVRTFTDYNTPFAVVASTNNQNVTGATGTATLAGTYMIVYEADVAVDNVADFSMLYRLHKTGAVAINNDNVVSVVGGTPIQTKIVATAVATLTAGQTVVLNVDTPFAVGASINSRSITMLKLS